MASDQDLVVETVRDILAGHEPFVLDGDRPWDERLWQALVDTGLTGVGVPEEAGGSGGEAADAVAIVRTLAAGAAAVPLAEQLLVAVPALLAAGLPVPPVDRPLTVAIAPSATAEPDGDGRFRLTGTVAGVPSAGVATLGGGAGRARPRHRCSRWSTRPVCPPPRRRTSPASRAARSPSTPPRRPARG